jgi:hypothetical protein
MADHVRFTVDTDIDVFFCDPHGPWQRGSSVAADNDRAGARFVAAELVHRQAADPPSANYQMKGSR